MVKPVNEFLLSHETSDPSVIPAYDLKKYYRTLDLTFWHELWITQSFNKLKATSPVVFH